MSSSGPLLILEGSMDPHWAWGFCSKWFFRDFSPSENKDMMFRMLPFHQDVSGGFSWRRCWVRTPYMTPQVDMFGAEKCITPINCSSLGDRLRNRGKEFHILKWVTTDSCVWSTGEEHKVWYLPLPSVKLRMLRILLTSW